jgi:hypothetical protein
MAEIQNNFGKYIKTGLGVVSIAVAVTAIVNAWDIYKHYVFKPKVKIIDVDYKNGRAIIEVNGTRHKLLYGSPFYVGDYWSVQMKTKENDKINRIELLKQGNVKEYLTT